MIAATLHLYAGALFTRSRCPGPGVQAGKLSSRTADAGVPPCGSCSPRHLTGPGGQPGRAAGPGSRAGQPGRARRTGQPGRAAGPGAPDRAPGPLACPPVPRAGAATRPVRPWPASAHQRPAPAAGTAGLAPPQPPRPSPPASPRESRSRPHHRRARIPGTRGLFSREPLRAGGSLTQRCCFPGRLPTITRSTVGNIHLPHGGLGRSCGCNPRSFRLTIWPDVSRARASSW
jgi:hypothetical protein